MCRIHRCLCKIICYQSFTFSWVNTLNNEIVGFIAIFNIDESNDSGELVIVWK